MYITQCTKKKIPIKFLSNFNKNILKKPDWIKIRYPSNMSTIHSTKYILNKNKLNTVCEQALCPNISECYNLGTATFMILGTMCTRKCPFCAVNHGKPSSVNLKEPEQLAQSVVDLNINHVVITSVVRDDLKDKGAEHFSNCIKAIRNKKKNYN